jgi:hypothetical protein
MNTTQTTPVVTACPRWCSVEHDGPGAFHAGPNGRHFRLWQADSPGAHPGVVVAGELLTPEQARNLARDLMHAADVLTPMEPGSFDIVGLAALQLGISMPALATLAGVDPESDPFTVADSSAMAHALGEELGRRARG